MTAHARGGGPSRVTGFIEIVGSQVMAMGLDGAARLGVGVGVGASGLVKTSTQSLSSSTGSSCRVSSIVELQKTNN